MLITRTKETESVRMDILYPSHAKALKVATLALEVFPTLGEVLDNVALHLGLKNMEKDNSKQDKQEDNTLSSGHE